MAPSGAGSNIAHRTRSGESIAVDVGANGGYVAAWLSLRSEESTVVAIEPNPRLVPVLERKLGYRGRVAVRLTQARAVGKNF